MVIQFPDYWNRVKIGDIIEIISDNPTYSKYRNKIRKVSGVFVGIKEHPYYNIALYPQALIECEGLPFALYEYEFEVV